MADERVRARKKKKKDRQLSKLGQPLLRTEVWVASKLVDNVAKRREVILFQDRIGSVQTVKNGHEVKLLEKVWVFASHHRLEPVKERSFDTIEPGRKSVLSVLTSNHHISRNLFAFSIKSQFGTNPSKLKSERLVLAFETSDEAQKWLEAIADRLAIIRRKQKPSLEIGVSRRVVSAESSEDGTEVTDVLTPTAEGHVDATTPHGLETRRSNDSLTAVQSFGQHPPQSSFDPRNPEHHANGASPVSSGDADSENEGMATPRGGMGSIFDNEEERMPLEDRASSLEDLHAELRADSYIGADFHHWTVVRTSNNVTVLRGNGEHNAKSLMLSYIVRAPPRLCVKTVLKRDHHGIELGSTTVKTEVVETVDPFNDRLEVTWTPSGLGSMLVLPRKMAAQRLWRREDDGTYVIIFKACEDESHNQSALGRLLAPAVKLDLVMTFSPLTSDFCPTGESSETLVTVTSDLGNFRGVWHLRSPLDWLFKLFYPFPFSHVSAYIDAIMEESIAVRTKAEAARFSVKPFLGSQNSGTLMRNQASDFVRPTGYHQHDQEPMDGSVQAPLYPVAELPPLQTELSGPYQSPQRVVSEELQPPVSGFATAQEAFEDPRSDSSVSASAYEDAYHKEYPDSDIQFSDASASDLPPKQPTLTPQEAATCDRQYWSCPGHNKLKVRGKQYLSDKKKIPADDPVFELMACDLMQVDRPTPHIARFLPSLKASKAPFTFIVQIMFGNPSLSLTFSWAAPDPASQQHLSTKLTKAMSKDIGPDSTSDWTADEDDLVDKPFELTLARFLAGSTSDAEANKRRDGVVKLIPQISKGPWFIKQAVGTTPCLLGRKLTALYHRGPGYFEVDVDVNSSSVAANIVGLVQGVTKKLWVDMAIVLEGHSIEELPEMLLGSVRCAHLDLDSAKLLDTTTGEIRDKPKI